MAEYKDMAAASTPHTLFRFDRKTPVRFVGLLSLLVIALVLFCILWPLRWNLAALWAAVECLFYIFYWRPRCARLSRQPKTHRPTEHDAMATFERCLRYFRETKGVDYEMYYSGWFLGAKLDVIGRGNAEEFLAYAFWYRTLQEMRDEGLGHVPAQMVAQLEEAWGFNLKPGYTPGLQFMGHLWEPLKAQWRPVAFYVSTELFSLFARQLLKRWGFQQHTHKALAYFTLNIQTADSSRHRRLATMARSSSVSSAFSEQSSSSTSSSCTAASTTPFAAATPGATAPAVTSGYTAASMTCDARHITAVATLPARRSQSSPFMSTTKDWAVQLAADAESLSASINAASAVHAPPPAPAPSPAASCVRKSAFAAAAAAAVAVASKASRRKRSISFQLQQRAPYLAPGLSTHTSVMLRSMPNPLEDALSDGLGSQDMPVLFLHGVGGLPAYLEMLLQVMALGHPVIAVEMNTVAMRLSSVQTADEVLAGVIEVMDRLGVKKACVVGHSYGTFIAGRLARLHRHRVHSLCLIDPVCFGMFMPQLLSNFLYTTPKWRGLHHIVDLLKQGGVYMASRELHVCATFSRGFFWSDLNLWPEDLAPGSVVLLSGRDDLMNAQQVQAMLTKAGHIKVHYNPELTHGEFLIKSEVKQAIMDEVRGMLARSGSAVVGLARPVLQTTMTLARSALGATAAVKMQTGSSGTRYVEDHTNKLVRTFTGNLTSVLQNMTSLRPSFSLIKQKQPQQQGDYSTPGTHSILHACPSRLSRSTGGGAGLGAKRAGSGHAHADVAGARPTAAAGAGILGSACSLPASSGRHGGVKFAKHIFGHPAEDACEAAALACAVAATAQDSNTQPQQHKPAAAPQSAAYDISASAPSVRFSTQAPLSGRESRMTGRRRSSGSGSLRQKVLVTPTGVQVAPAIRCPDSGGAKGV